jgi:hypothetical protein
MRKAKHFALVAVLMVSMGACAAHVNHPGTANTFDSDSYDTLLVTDSVIQSTKADYAAGTVPAAIMPQVKTALNDLIRAYDAADVVYIAYHNAAMAGSATTAQQSAVASALATVGQKTAALTSAKAGS